MNLVTFPRTQMMHWLSACCVLVLCGTRWTVAAESYLIFVNEKTTLSLQLTTPFELSPELRAAIYTDSNSIKLETELMSRLDADQNGVLSVDEVTKAELLLGRLDYDEDECLAPLEIASDLLTSTSQRSAALHPRISTVLVRSQDDAEGLEKLRVELRRFGHSENFSIDLADAVLALSATGYQGASVPNSDSTAIQVKELNDRSGANRLRFVKDELIIDFAVERPLHESIYIHARPGRIGLFELLDSNGDSKLSRLELRAAAKPNLVQSLNVSNHTCENSLIVQVGSSRQRLTSISLLPRSTEMNHRQITTDWFGATDRNRDEVISMNEFLAGDKQFRNLDANGDGLLTRDEVVKK